MRSIILGGHKLRARMLLPVAVVALAGSVLTACSSSASSSPAVAKTASVTSGAQKYQGHLSLEPSTGVPGTVVKVVGSGLPSGQEVQISWQQITGSWQTTSGGELLGASYSQTFKPLTSAATGADGSLSASFVVPVGFGNSHAVQVSEAGKTINEATFKIPVSAAISPQSGPVGTPIHVKVAGIGSQEYRQNWYLMYDQHVTGWLSAVTTEGIANAIIPATGTPGVHELSIYEAPDREPYLNTQQTPTKNPMFTMSFTVTPGDPVLPPPADAQSSTPVLAATPTSVSNAPAVWLNYASGPPGTPLVVKGSGFPAGQTVKVNWATQKGNHLYGLGAADSSIATATASSAGTFEASFAVPSDLGQPHKITATAGSVSASTSFAISPKDAGITPTSGPVGTQITLHLLGTGVSWTSNIYGVDYDNSDIGYACGVNSNGDITLNLPATGAPGWHYIVFYPAVWNIVNMKFATADYIQVSQLTYAADHPGEKLSAFEFAFQIK
ncbi:MAG: hypothetical protein EPN30_00250 [Actinomycetota bacterium]|nr:MAG: hypothetical protein EPN30_00250 [Actinomycetota bacterium]